MKKANRIINKIRNAAEQGETAEDIFWDAETRANRLTAWGMLGVGLLLTLYCLALILFEDGYDPIGILIVLLVELVLLVPLGVYCLCVKGRKRRLKRALLFAIVLGTAALQVLFPLESLLLLLLPVVLSSQYFSVSFTRMTAITMGILYVIAVLVGIRFKIVGDYDLNYMILPAGTVLNAVEDTWLLDLVNAAEFDTPYILQGVMFASVPPKLFLYALVSGICVIVARRGRRMVLKESADAAERASMETELSLAAEIQLSVLPENFQEIRDRMGIDLFATMDPAKEVGGDFYDFFAVDDDHVAFVVADVSGKGVPAALFMMTGKSLIRTCIQSKLSPAKALTSVNAQLSQNNKADLFITAWLGVLEISSGRLLYANAGHCRPLLYQKANGAYRVLDELHGIALACFDDTEYTQTEIWLTKDDAIFLYTDGVTELSDHSGEMYGTARLTEYLDANIGRSPEGLLREIRETIDDFDGDKPQFDDITMLMLRV